MIRQRYDWQEQLYSAAMQKEFASVEDDIIVELKPQLDEILSEWRQRRAKPASSKKPAPKKRKIAA
jgi:hypothetical protein